MTVDGAVKSDSSGSSTPPRSPTVGRDHAGIPEKDLDQAYKYLETKDLQAAQPADEINVNALRRKIDWRIVPIMFACYTMQFIDKVLLNVRCFSAHLPAPLKPRRRHRRRRRRRCCCC